MPTRSERRRSRVRLTVAEVTAEREAAAAAPEFPLLPVALIGGAASALAGWLLVSGLVMIGWFTAMAMPVPTALGFAGQVWLAGHGAGAMIGNLLVTLTPLGLSALFVVVVRAVTGLGLRATSADNLDGRGALRAWGLAATGYALVVVVVALASGAGSRVGSAALGGLLIGGLGAGWALAGRLRTLTTVPAAVRGIGRAVLAGLATMAAIAAVVLVIGLVRGSERISVIEASLAPDAVGSWLLVGLQLLYLPNLLAWATSWALGAGISVGLGSLVSPMLTTAGLLPAIPVFGAVPDAGPGRSLELHLAGQWSSGRCGGRLGGRPDPWRPPQPDRLAGSRCGFRARGRAGRDPVRRPVARRSRDRAADRHGAGAAQPGLAGAAADAGGWCVGRAGALVRPRTAGAGVRTGRGRHRTDRRCHRTSGRRHCGDRSRLKPGERAGARPLGCRPWPSASPC